MIKIEHLVISGGGPSLYQSIGIIQALENGNSKYDISNLKTIYASSAGAIVAFLMCLNRYLNYDWATINEYMINRPWEDIFTISMHKVLEAYSNRGLFNTETIQKCFHSFFDAKDIDYNISLKDFHDKIAPIDLHFFAFELNEFKLDNISWKTHPNITLFDALHMTCSLPILFSPVVVGDMEDEEKGQHKCYLDGGIISNYPLKHCIENMDETAINSVLGIKNVYDYSKLNRNINKSSTLFDYLLSFIFKIIHNISDKNIPSIPNEIECPANFMTFEFLKSVILEHSVRQSLLDNGKTIGGFADVPLSLEENQSTPENNLKTIV